MSGRGRYHPGPAEPWIPDPHGFSDTTMPTASLPATRILSDPSLQDLLCERLWRSGMDVSEVSLAVREAHVTLDGAVGSRAARRAIADSIERVPGVQGVENRIRVAPDRTGMR